MRVSSPDKVLYPSDGITKAEVVAYYEAGASRMIGHVAGRPLTLQRFPQGIGSKGFMQKNAADHFPDSIERFEVAKVDGGATVYPVVWNADDLPYLANLNTISFHVWTSRLPRPGHIDRMIFDLDPPEGDIEGARRATRLVADRLETYGLASAVMTTGSKGFHVIAAIEPTAGDDVARFAWAVAQMLAADYPDNLTDEFRIANRKGRVFVDWLRNRPGATGIAPWSLRPRPGAPVATPITWAELDDTEPGQWTLQTVTQRFGTDPVADHCATPQPFAGAASTVQEEAHDRGIQAETFDRFRS